MPQTTLQLTDNGVTAMRNTLSGGTITFTKFSIGNGAEPSDYKTLTGLVNSLMDISLTSITSGTNYVEVVGSFDNSSVTEEFNWNELGLWAKGSDNVEFLYAYMNQENKENIPSNSSPRVVEETISAQVVVGNAENVSAIVSSITYASKADLNAHVNDKSNPHGVTASDVGLGNAETVPVNSMTPTYSVSNTNQALVSGETMQSAFSKIAKAVSSLLSHLTNTVLHITETDRATWNGKANSSHTHKATDINSGILPIERGGTGVTDGFASLIYKPGDVINVGRMMCIGCLTGSGKTVGWFVPLSRPIIGATSAAVNNPNSATITARCIDGYIMQGVTIASLQAEGSVTLTICDNGIEFSFEASAAWSENNTPLQISLTNLKIDLS